MLQLSSGAYKLVAAPIQPDQDRSDHSLSDLGSQESYLNRPDHSLPDMDSYESNLDSLLHGRPDMVS